MSKTGDLYIQQMEDSMTTSVTIKNNGPYRVNVNSVDVSHSDNAPDNTKTVKSQTLAIGEETTLHLWGGDRYLNVIETNDVDTPETVNPSKG